MNRTRVRIWDLPTRLFHWALVICLIGSLISVSLGGNAVEWHFRFGYGILTLLLWRVLWGFLGPRYARFSHFLGSPALLLARLRGKKPAPAAGHNPWGALSVYVMLKLLFLQVLTGLFANDSILWDGPLRPLVSGETSDLITTLHRLNRWLLLGFIGLHLCAITWYQTRRRARLVQAMVTGDHEFVTNQELPAPARDNAAVRWSALGLLIVSAAAVTWLVTRAAL